MRFQGLALGNCGVPTTSAYLTALDVRFLREISFLADLESETHQRSTIICNECRGSSMALGSSTSSLSFWSRARITWSSAHNERPELVARIFLLRRSPRST